MNSLSYATLLPYSKGTERLTMICGLWSQLSRKMVTSNLLASKLSQICILATFLSHENEPWCISDLCVNFHSMMYYATATIMNCTSDGGVSRTRISRIFCTHFAASQLATKLFVQYRSSTMSQPSQFCATRFFFLIILMTITF